MNDHNGFDDNGVYHFNYSPQPIDPWDREQKTPLSPPHAPKKNRNGAGKAVADAAGAVASTVADKVREEAPVVMQKGRDAVNAVAARFAAEGDGEGEVEGAEAPVDEETAPAAEQPDESDPV